MQSLIIVLMKVLLQTVTALTMQLGNANLANPSPSTATLPDPEKTGARGAQVNGGHNAATPGTTAPAAPPAVVPELSPQDFDRLRTQEIMIKAVSSILLLLLKWFKLSRMWPPNSCNQIERMLTFYHLDILKFEHLSQLLFDSNYIPLTLKLFLHQDIERVVQLKRERKHLK